MNKKVKEAVERILKEGKPRLDAPLQMAVMQGYVSEKCSLDGGLVMALVNSGKDPCDGCNMDRKKCGGRNSKGGIVK